MFKKTKKTYYVIHRGKHRDKDYDRVYEGEFLKKGYDGYVFRTNDSKMVTDILVLRHEVFEEYATARLAMTVYNNEIKMQKIIDYLV